MIDNIEISTDPARLDLDAIFDFLSKQAYWSIGRPREIIEKSLKHSLCFGMYHNNEQIGLARVVTDYATYAYLCDVFIRPDYRGNNLGKRLIEAVVEHPELSPLRRFMLITGDAHGLYEQYGFKVIEEPEKHMEKLRPKIVV